MKPQDFLKNSVLWILYSQCLGFLFWKITDKAKSLWHLFTKIRVNYVFILNELICHLDRQTFANFYPTPLLYFRINFWIDLSLGVRLSVCLFCLLVYSLHVQVWKHFNKIWNQLVCLSVRLPELYSCAHFADFTALQSSAF